jgi:phospholipase/carboxylesterase
VAALVHAERPASGAPAGLLILHHGRGTNEHDLLGLADAVDPAQRLHVLAPRAPLELPGAPGYHWYVVPRVGYPDPSTFERAYRGLAEFHDEVWARTGVSPAHTVLGGFSMGAVMSYALGLGPDRPPVAGILALSGFIPTVPGHQPSFADRLHTRAFIAHGRNDPVIDVGFARAARDTLEAAGLEVEYHESELAHQVDPRHVPAAASWLAGTIAPASA